MINSRMESLEIKEKFVPVGTKTIDTKNRVSLGGRVAKALSRRMKVDAFQVFLGENGDVLLKPMTNVPSNEAWLYKNRAALKDVASGVRDAKTGKVKKIVDLNEFLNDL